MWPGTQALLAMQYTQAVTHVTQLMGLCLLLWQQRMFPFILMGKSGEVSHRRCPWVWSWRICQIKLGRGILGSQTTKRRAGRSVLRAQGVSAESPRGLGGALTPSSPVHTGAPALLCMERSHWRYLSKKVTWNETVLLSWNHTLSPLKTPPNVTPLGDWETAICASQPL